MNVTGNAVPEINKAKAAVGSLNSQINKSGAVMRQHNQITTQQSKNFKFLRGAAQQLGFQVGDYAVQVANGTSKMQAFGQQGAQMLGVFGPIGALLGAGVAIFSAVAVAAEKSGKATFDFNAMLKDMKPALDVVRPVLERVGGLFRLMKSAAVAAINGIINGIQYFIVTVGAIPRAISAFAEKAELRLRSFGLSVRAVMYDARASVQELVDMMTPGGPEGGFLMGEDGGISGTAAENFRELAANARGQAEVLSDTADRTAGAFSTLKDAINGVVAIDIRDYFTKAAEAVDGKGAGGAGSLSDALSAAQERMQSLADAMKDSFTSGFMSIVDGTKSAKEAFKDMARSIIAKLYEVLVVQRLVGQFNAATGQGTGIVGAIMGLFGKRATGGPITAGKPYMVGEKGPELVVPSRNGNVVPNNQLSGGGIQIIQNNTFGQGVSRAEINAMLPKIVETTKAAVFDAQRRSVGGRGYA
jgi:hypothetical protein